MRLLTKLAMKLGMLLLMAVLMGTGLRHGQRYIMQVAGMPTTAMPGMETPKFSSDEADLMSVVFQSALRLFSGSANRHELAGELSDKLYAGRAGAGEMAELGIELVKPGAESAPAATAGAKPPTAATPPAKPGAPAAASAKPGTVNGKPAAAAAPSEARDAMLASYGKMAKAYTLELSLIPVAFLVMFLMHRIRQRRSRMEDLLPLVPDMQEPSDAEPYEMKHALRPLSSEDFELLVALIYQRQGYRVSMSAALSGGRGGDFTLARKAERVLVQCKKMSHDHRVPVERVRELHEALATAGATRGMYVASCGFTWDAKNFARSRNITLINARTLDELLTAARETPEENLLAVADWVPKFLGKAQMTSPLCPACEAAMDQVNVSNGSVWLCSERPECRGRRSARKHQKVTRAGAKTAEPPADGIDATPAGKVRETRPLASAR